MLQVEPASRPSSGKIEEAVKEAAVRRGDFHAGDGGIRATYQVTPNRDMVTPMDISFYFGKVSAFEKGAGDESQRVKRDQDHDQPQDELQHKGCACLIQ